MFVEPSEQHPAAALGFGHGELARSRKAVAQSFLRNHFRKERRRRGALNPSADLPSSGGAEVIAPVRTEVLSSHPWPVGLQLAAMTFPAWLRVEMLRAQPGGVVPFGRSC